MRKLSGIFADSGSIRYRHFAVVSGIALVTLIAAAGCAIDYYRLSRVSNKLQAAAEIASSASIARTSPAFAYAASMTADGPIPAGAEDAASFFDANLSGLTGFALDRLNATVTRTGSNLRSTVQFSAHVPSPFLGLMGLRKQLVSGGSTATVPLPAASRAPAKNGTPTPIAAAGSG